MHAEIGRSAIKYARLCVMGMKDHALKLKPRLHDAAGCQTGCQTGLTTG